MSSEPEERRAGGVVTAIAPAGARARQASIEERRRLVSESLQIGNPGNRARDLPEQADPRHDCQIEVKVDDIRPYEHNPRRANNAKFAEIKESIRATGIRNPLTVTRRPGEKHFIIEAGGNTRLLAVQQLWAETRDPRFEKLTVLFRPWRSDAHVLVAHLIENEQRGDLTFWDKANGVIALKAQLEEEKGRTLSLKQLEGELKASGYPISTATLAYYVYATTRLHVLAEAIPALSGWDVKTIQPRLNLIRRYAQMRGAMDEANLYASVFEPVFRLHADCHRETGTFDASALCQACEEAFARHVGEDLAQFRMTLDVLAQSPQVASLDSLARIGTAEDALGVNPVNGVPEATDPPEARQTGGQPAIDRPTIDSKPDASGVIPPSVLRHLKASVGRFERLSVQRGLEGRAQLLLALILGQVERSTGIQLLEVPAYKGEGSAGPVTLDPELLDWLFDGRDEAATAFWEIATLIRRLRGNVTLRLGSARHSRSEGSE